MLKQNLNLKLTQKLSPQQIQLMKLLQIPTASLEQRIKEELEANPALEEGEDRDENELRTEDVSDEYYGEDEEGYYGDNDHEEVEPKREEEYELDDYISDYIDDDPSSYKLRTEGNSDEEDKSVPVASESSFHDFLEQQLGLLNFNDPRRYAIAHQIVGSIDDDGYLRRDTLAIADDLAFSQNIITTEDEVLEILAQIQRFEPPGIGARDLRECLLLQLRNRIEQQPKLTKQAKAVLQTGYRLLLDYFDEFSKKHYPKLQRQLNVTEVQLKAAIDEILKLNPKPASGHSSSNMRSTQYVVPDFILINREGELELSLNSRNAPDLRINDHYRDMLRSYKGGSGRGKRSDRKQREAVLFIKQKIDSAKWFIDAIRQRQQTMYRTMYAIMQYQADFFMTGDQKKLKPMILKDIADITGLDISTVSRVANSKFVQTEFGTKRLKDFFSESLQTSEGEEVSTLEVKKILTDIIGDENKKKPLSDERLKTLLLRKGYNIARRTVAKYREQLNIPVARLRKEL